MHPFFARILDKPVCAILDGCLSISNMLSAAHSFLFGPTQPKNSLQLRYNTKNYVKPPPPLQPGTKREPATLHGHKVVEPDNMYRYRPMSTLETYVRSMELKDLGKEDFQEPPTRPSWFRDPDELPKSLIKDLKIIRSSFKPLVSYAQEDSVLDEEDDEDYESHEPIRSLGYNYLAAKEKDEVDGFIIIW